MVFYGLDGQEIGMAIENLEFPQLPAFNNDFFDNPLMIHISIKSNFGNFDHSNPVLELSEFKDLIKWLKKLSNNKCVNTKWDGTIEDFFEFELFSPIEDNIKKIKIYFYEDKKYFIESYMSNNQLLEYANQLRNELKILYKQFSIRKHLYKLLEKGIDGESNGITVKENASIFKKNNFIDRYDTKEGYKIIYSDIFIKDLNKIKNNTKIKYEIDYAIDSIKDYPFDIDILSWDDFLESNGIRFKMLKENIIFYYVQTHEYNKVKKVFEMKNQRIVFLRLLEKTINYESYLKYMVNRFSD
jgi:hypothetical protein